MGGIVRPKGSLNSRDNNNFQPRLGLAWSPVNKWVFRGGFAVNTVDVKFPGGQFDEYQAKVVQARAPGDPRPMYQISSGPNPVAFNILPNGTALYVGTNYSSRSSTRWDPAMRNPYALNWNASIQRELTANYLLELSYQGSAGVGLIESWNILNSFGWDFAANDPALRAKVFAAPQNYRPFPNWGDVSLRSNFGHSTYHGGTVKIEKRYSRGLNFMAFYMLSKCIDSGQSIDPLNTRALGKGRCDYDRNHRFAGTNSLRSSINTGLP
jgi:hypothetical protein